MIKEEIYGFIEFDDKNNPFIYYDGILRILPNDKKNWKVESSNLFKQIVSSLNKNEVVKPFMLNGITSHCKGITFWLDGVFSNDSGIKEYSVIAYHLYLKNYYVNHNGIDGLHFMSDELNLFLKPYLCYRYFIPTTENKIDNPKVGLSDFIEYKCGTIRYLNHKLKIKISINPQAQFNNSNPFHSFTKMSFYFDKSENNIEKILKFINLQSDFLRYICYRKNIVYNNIETFVYENGVPFNIGNIYLVNTFEKEVKKNNMEFNNISSILNKLFNDLKTNKMALNHIPENREAIHHYSASRAIGIFSCFERECDLLGINVRNEEFFEIRNSIVDLIKIEQNKDIYNTKKRKYIKQIINSIEKIDCSMADYYAKVFFDNIKVIEHFIKKNYHKKRVTKSFITNLSVRLNVIRNGLVHSKLDFKFNHNHLLDLKMLEILIYSNRLKHYDLSESDIIQSINSIF